jgi:hypothetical protein
MLNDLPHLWDLKMVNRRVAARGKEREKGENDGETLVSRYKITVRQKE